jgi:hypothetical protein
MENVILGNCLTLTIMLLMDETSLSMINNFMDL